MVVDSRARFFLFGLFLGWSAFLSAAHSPVEPLLDEFHRALRQGRFDLLAPLVDPLLLENPAFAEACRNEQASFQNCHRAVVKRQIVEGEETILVSEQALWTATHFQTGDVIAKPIKQNFFFSREGGKMLLQRIENPVFDNYPLLNKAISHLLSRNLDESLQTIQLLLKDNDQMAAVFYLFGYAMMLLEKMDLAEKSFQKCLALDPLFYPARAFLSICLKKNLFPDNPKKGAEAYFNLLTLVNLGESEKVIKLGSQWVEQFPGESTLHHLLAKGFLQRGDIPRAGYEFERSETLSPGNYETLFNLVQLYIKAAKWEEAWRRIEEGHTLFPRQPGFIYLKACYHAERGEPQTAARILNPFLKKFINYQPAIELQARLENSASELSVPQTTARAGD